MTAPSTGASTRPTVPSAPRSAPIVGTALSVIGFVHLLVAPLLYGDALRSIIDGGVLASIDADPALNDLRAAGFWYVTAGIGVIALGLLATWAQRQLGSLPTSLAWLLLLFGAWGIVLMPVSPFWLFPVIAVFAFRSARHA